MTDRYIVYRRYADGRVVPSRFVACDLETAQGLLAALHLRPDEPGVQYGCTLEKHWPALAAAWGEREEARRREAEEAENDKYD